MQDTDLATLRAILQTSLVGAGLAAAIMAFVFNRSFPEGATGHVDRMAYWRVLRKLTVLLFAFVAGFALLSTLGAAWTLLTYTPEGPYPPLREASSPLLDPLNPTYGVVAHPEAIVPFAVVFLSAAAVFTFILAIAYLSYLFYRYEAMGGSDGIAASLHMRAHHASGMERWFVTAVRYSSRAMGQSFERLFVRHPYTLIIVSITIVTILTVLNHATGSVNLPRLSTTMILAPLILAELLILLAANSSDFIRVFGKTNVRIAVFATRLWPTPTGSAVKQVLTRGGSSDADEVLPGRDNLITFPVCSPDAEAKMTPSQVIEEHLLKVMPDSHSHIGPKLRDYPLMFGYRNFRVLIFEVDIVEPHDNGFQTSPPEHDWRDLNDIIHEPRADPELRKICEAKIVP